MAGSAPCAAEALSLHIWVLGATAKLEREQGHIQPGPGGGELGGAEGSESGESR